MMKFTIFFDDDDERKNLVWDRGLPVVSKEKHVLWLNFCEIYSKLCRRNKILKILMK